MKYYVKFLVIIFSCFFVRCDKQQFYGDTFYTVEGTIVNVDNVPLSEFQLQVLGIKQNGFQIIFFGIPDSEIIIAKSATNKQGRFRITFPNNNGNFALQVAPNYNIVFPAGAQPSFYQSDMLAIDKAKFSDFYLDLGIIKVQN